MQLNLKWKSRYSLHEVKNLKERVYKQILNITVWRWGQTKLGFVVQVDHREKEMRTAQFPPQPCQGTTRTQHSQQGKSYVHMKAKAVPASFLVKHSKQCPTHILQFHSPFFWCSIIRVVGHFGRVYFFACFLVRRIFSVLASSLDVSSQFLK
jgi:hypothetical protein